MQLRRTTTTSLAALCVAGSCWLAACAPSPFERRQEDELRRSVANSVQRELADAEAHPEPLQVTNDPGLDRLGISPERYDELNELAGPDSWDTDIAQLPLNTDLLGQEQDLVAISLRHAVRTGVENNLQTQFARLDPAVAEAQVVAAEAVFDWIFFSNSQYSRTDQPTVGRLVGGIPVGTTAIQSDVLSNDTGLRRTLRSGGSLTLQQTLSQSDENSPGITTTPNPAEQVALTVQLDQPLLRNFGSDVTLSQVRLTRNLERNAVLQLKRTLITTTTDIERAYWDLYLSYADLIILDRLLQRGVEVRNQVRERQLLDATPAQVADAVSTVEQRKSNVLRAQVSLRVASDRLKGLMNDPRFPVGTEVLLVPTEDAIDEPIEISLLDAIAAAVQHRPEVAQAVLSIDDTSIRKVVADNQRLPQLDLRLQAQSNGLSSGFGDAYQDVFDGKFVDYLVGLFFEQPIGNRAGEALVRQRRLERMQAVISYRNTIQQVILELKNAYRNIRLNYELIPQTRRARYAATEVLRALLVEKITTGTYTVERLDLELRRQETLAQREREEIRALVDYNTSIADYYAAIGQTLERNRIDFVVPNADEVFDKWGKPRTDDDHAGG